MVSEQDEDQAGAGVSISRRTLLRYLLAGGAGLALPAGIYPAQADSLEATLRDIIGGLEIGLDLRRIDPATREEDWHIQINAEELYPVASCFKSWLVLYYLWHTPVLAWETDQWSDIYRTIVFSNNQTTGLLLDEIAGRVDVFGNPIQKFNDFLLFTMGMTNGLYSWNWEGTPTQDLTDPRFSPRRERLVFIHGQPARMDNLTTAAELADGYTRLIQPDPFPDADGAHRAVAAALDLLVIPAGNYRSPIENAFNRAYIGKDGVLPASDSAIGRVINDAGVLQIGDALYVLAYLCAGEGEYIGLNVLRQIAGAIADYETG